MGLDIIGYVPDSDDDDYDDDQAYRVNCKTVIAKRRSYLRTSNSTEDQDKFTKMNGKVEGPIVAKDQVSLVTEGDKLELDHETENSLQCSQNSYSDKCLNRINRTRIRKLYNDATSTAEEETLLKTRGFVGSQELGELSLATAMNVVEKLLCDNEVELFEGTDDLRKPIGSNSPPILSIKGALSMARWTNERRSSDRKTRIFDWSESDIDDYRGGSLSQRKELYSECQGGAHQMLKTSENLTNRRVTSLETPGSRLIQDGSSSDKTHVFEREAKHLPDDVDEKLETDYLEQQDEFVDAGMYDIGPNTQMAAEAMEALFHGSPVNHGQWEVADEEIDNLNEASNLFEELKSSSPKNVSPQKRVAPVHDMEGNLVHSKQRKLSNFNRNLSSSRKHCRNSRAKNNSKKAQGKGAKTDKLEHEACLSAKVAANSNELYACPNQDKGSGQVAQTFSKEDEKYRISWRSSIRSSVIKSTLLGNLPFNAIRVAPRTRRSKPTKTSKWITTLDTFGKNFPGDKMGDKNHVADKSGTVNSKRFSANKCQNEATRLYQKVQDLKHMPKKSSSLNTVIRKNGTRPSRSGSENKVSFKSLLDTVKRKRRTVSYIKGSSNSGVRIASSVNSPSFIPCEKKDSEERNTDISEVGLMPATDNDLSVIDYRASTAEVASMDESPAAIVPTAPDSKHGKTAVVSPKSEAQYLPKTSCGKGFRKSPGLRELLRLEASVPAASWLPSNSRRRKDLSKVRVLFSNHLDDDVIKQQKKILARFRVHLAPNVAEATHFVADRFARTKNMLEAMAMGKPVVTHMWLDNCARANYFIDGKNYILRDLKKEKEIGFSMPVSLAHARQCPVLQGRRVFITPNVKPDREIVGSLVEAAHGQLVESNANSAIEDDKQPDNLLVISCEEDYSICISLLDKGFKVFSSDIVLNGIIIQKLEFDRYQLFANHVKTTS